jgi:3,5-epimerase/4-reductase
MVEAVVKMKTYIFGAGYLGERISQRFEYHLSRINVLYPQPLRECLDRNKPDVVINCVGKTGRPNIDWCETHHEETDQSNIDAAVQLAEECSKRGIYFVHISSGCIYQGDNGGKGFNEEDEPNFSGSYYSRSKAQAEKKLKDYPCLQLRIRMPIDEFPHERNLIGKLLSYKKVIDIPNSMTTIPHMLGALEQLILKQRLGIYNLTNPGVTTAFEVMSMYRDIVDPNYQPVLMSPDELDKATLGKRSNCILNADKLKNEGIILPEIHDGVRECLIKYKEYLK